MLCAFKQAETSLQRHLCDVRSLIFIRETFALTHNAEQAKRLHTIINKTPKVT